MTQLPTRSHNRFHPPAWLSWVVVGGGSLLYLWLFLGQPSLLGMVDGAGQPLSRWADLLQILLWEQLLDSMAGHGRFALGFLDRVPLLLGLLAWLAVAICIGWPWIALRLSWLEHVAIAAVTGLALLSTLTLVIGWAGGLASRLPLGLGVAGMLLLAGVAGRRNSPVTWLRSAIGNPGRPWPAIGGKPPGKPARASAPGQVLDERPGNLVTVWLLRLVPVGTCALAGLTLYGCLMPPWEFDVVEYHLQAPKEYFQAGRISFNRHNIYANMPLGAEMHALAAMTLVGGSDGWWTGGLIGKAMIGSFSLLAAALLGGFVGRHIGRWGGWAAAGLLLATPGSAHVSMAGLIDMVLATYVLATFVVLLELWPQLRRGQCPWESIFLVSVLAGAAAACKYPGLLMVTLPVVAVLVGATCLSRKRDGWAPVVVAGGLGLAATCLPWYLRNWVATGNPFFPLAASWFGAGPLSAEQLSRWHEAHRVPATGGHSAYSLAAAWSSFTQVALASTFLQPALVPLAVCGVVQAWLGQRGSDYQPPADSAAAGLAAAGSVAGAWWPLGKLLLAAWIAGLWWFATHRIDRFLLPALPLICGLAALGGVWIGRRLSHALPAAWVLLGLAYGGLAIVSGAIGDNRFFVSLQALREDAGDDQFPGRVSPAIDWANQSLADSASRLLLIGEARAYDFQMPIVYATCFDHSPAERWLRDLSPTQQRANLRRAGITHVMVNWSELARYRSPGNYGYSDWPTREDIAQLVASDVLRPFPSPLEPERVEFFSVAD